MGIPKVIHYCWFGGKPLPVSYTHLVSGFPSAKAAGFVCICHETPNGRNVICICKTSQR